MVENTGEESDSLRFDAITALNLHFPHRRPSVDSHRISTRLLYMVDLFRSLGCPVSKLNRFERVTI